MYQIFMWGMALLLSAAVFITTFTGISEAADKIDETGLESGGERNRQSYK